MPIKKLNVAVLMGGPSAEHEVSLSTGKEILNALDKNKYNVTPVIIAKDAKWLLPKTRGQFFSHGKWDPKKFFTCSIGQALDALKSKLKIDVVFIAMHGTYGEDGVIQGFLEVAGLPYTGSGVLASALAMDKAKASKILSAHGLKIPKSLEFLKSEWVVSSIDKIRNTFSLPIVIKPSNCGSSVGISIVRKNDELEKAINLAFKYDATVVVQEYISGVEVTCGVLDEGGKKDLVALPPTEIVPKESDFFDYKVKYKPGATDKITPARLPEKVIKKIQEIALLAHKIIGCAGMSRTDMIVRGDDIFMLEINTIPGMTPNSLYPKAAAVYGIKFPDLLDRLIGVAKKKR